MNSEVYAQTRMVLRPMSTPPFPAGFWARSSGWRQAGADYCSRRKPGAPYLELMWTVEGAGILHVDGAEYQVEKDMVFFLLPERFRYYRTASTAWHFRWLTMDGPAIISFFYSLQISPEPRRVGPCPEDDFESLLMLLSEPSQRAQRLATATAFKILLCASAPTSTGNGQNEGDSNPLIATAVQEIERGFREFGFDVNELARRLGKERTSLSRHFKTVMGVTPSAYIARKRFQLATRLLSLTSLQIKEIARQCGFLDADYFSRWFKQRSGVSPGEFRFQLFDT
ncbi:MAG: AraC family transcriptional regulator [Lentisphaerae bacterium]|nr:MAG: AraC family transcriptional regulator [Lentisphaerota bacterium]